MSTTVTAAPFTARQCPECKAWIYVADGPFEDDDATKTSADADHWFSEHVAVEEVESLGATAASLSKTAIALGFPYFDWNEQPVEATRNPWKSTHTWVDT